MEVNDLERHYNNFWGRAGKMINISRGDQCLQILRWEQVSHPDGLNVYATVGASIQQLSRGSHKDGFELFLGISPDMDSFEISALLLSVVFEYLDNNEGPMKDHPLLFHGQSYLVANVGVRGIIIVDQHDDAWRPFRNSISPLRDSKMNTVHFFEIAMITGSEVEFATKHGVDELVNDWHRRKIAYWARS